MTIINNIEIDNIRYNENEIKKAILNNDPIEDKLHVIIVLSNPCNYAIRYILTKEFIRRMKEEEHIILYIVELAYYDQEYHITELDNNKHLRLRSSHTPIWHKENLINIGIHRLLPKNWKAVAWIDADIEFDNPSWALDTLKILNGCKDIVQLFSHNIFMDPNGDTELILTGFGFQHSKKTKRSTRIKDINSYWHPGFAWACTRKLYEKIHGLYEFAITGDGDMQMASCFISNYESSLPSDVSEDYKKTLKKFEDSASGNRLGYVPGIIRHYYHGSINSRKYDLREHLLTKYNYSPTVHLTKNKDGLLIPTTEFPKELLNCIINHFQSKNEDESILNKKSSIITTNSIDLAKLLEFHFKKTLSINCILINIKKDTARFKSSKEELEKLSINIGTFTHFDATYWKETENLENVLNTVITFLKQFNTDITIDKIKINMFSETNDFNIKIQDGPLACYCSHLKAMMHGYLNFSDYTIIIEDDISVDSTINIEKYIKLVPNDWDIICLNSQPLSNNKDPFYKFNNTFYHLHFYIIKNTCLETIFRNIYPITDQIDVLIGNLHDKLNIYNIVNTVSQKNFITNIQNNIHVIYNTSTYYTLREEIKSLEDLCFNYVNDRLKGNIFNRNITNKILEDVVYNNIFNNIEDKFSVDPNILVQNIVNNNKLYDNIQKIVAYFIKDHNTDNFISHLIEEIEFIIRSFELHNNFDKEYSETMKAYNFGSTSSVYLLEKNNIVIKSYNIRLRWKTKNHDNVMNIFNKELSTLHKLNIISSYDSENLIIKMPYKGESLYDNFTLPHDWKIQIKNIFTVLSNNNIYYPEFNLRNIVILNNIISFIDYGLSHNVENCRVDNEINLKIFVELIELLNDKFSETNDRHVLYNTFMNNLKRLNKYPENIF